MLPFFKIHLRRALYKLPEFVRISRHIRGVYFRSKNSHIVTNDCLRNIITVILLIIITVSCQTFMSQTTIAPVALLVLLVLE